MEKKAFLTLVLFISLFSTTFAQENISSEKKTYKADDGTLFYNLTTPMYFWISTSPTDNTNDVLLKSSTSPQYSNPMYLDMEGYNTLRTDYAVNQTTKKVVVPQTQVRYEIYADGSAPVTTSSYLIAEKYKTGTVQYYGKGLEINLKSTDPTSGIENIYYSLNGATFQKYTKPLEINSQGEVKLKYFALDNCGNEEKVHESTFFVDNTPPVTLKQIDGMQVGNVLSQKATISLVSTDNLSGVKATYYSIDGKKAELYTKPLSAMLFFGGEHTLTYYSIDNVNNNNISNFGENTDSKFSFEFVVDKDGPEAELTFTGDQYTAKQLFVSSRTKFEIKATDTYSKIEQIKYGYTIETNETYSSAVTIGEKNGLTVLNYFAQDEIGNIGKKYQRAFFVDNTEPSSYIEIGEPQFFHRDTLFINPKTEIKIVSSDLESGLAKVEYSIDGAAYQTYSSSFKIDKAGYHKVSFKGTDNVNNVEVAKDSYIFIDNLSPEIYVNFSIEPIREETKNGVAYPVYPTYSKLYLSATDKSTGEEEIYFSVNGGTLTKYAGADKITAAGLLSKEQFYTLKIVAKDKLGNENEKTINFFISKK